MASKLKSKATDRVPNFYEMDGALRAYSNRSIVVAGVMGLVSLISVVGFFLVRMEPPTVIRVNSQWEPSVISPYRTQKARFLPSVLGAKPPDAEPNEYEKQAFVRTFLTRYLNYDPHSLGQNWADAMNFMTINLRTSALAAMEKNNTVGKLEEEQASSTFKLSQMEKIGDNPPTYTAFGVRTVRSLTNDHELIDQLVEEYHVRLRDADRSADNPAGLLIGDYWSDQIEGERRNAILADSTLDAQSTPVATPNSNNEGGKQ